ncbi:MAG: hypothetical protein JJV98_20735 [Desulfosarcina sp.]|nr:hypothetical protein [Desulfobacterales bacterium]
MEDKIDYLMHYCATIDFGKFTPSNREKAFYDQLNMEIMRIIKSLPASIQTGALLELIKHLKLPIERKIDFFKGFYPPAWSILYWLLVSFSGNSILSGDDLKNYNTVHASAMLLHLIDDHLTDKEMPVTHLAILLRSQLWMFMNQALKALTQGNDGDVKTVRQFIDDYYVSIGNAEKIDALDTYCDRFRKQMGMGFIAPVLMTKRMTADEQLIKVVKTVYGAFGIAWRLLDDLKDIPEDMRTNTKSSVYICLPEISKKYWNSHRRSSAIKNNEDTERIVDCLLSNKIIERITKRICGELDSAASLADAFRVQGFSNELLCMAESLRKNRAPDEFKS